MSVVKKKSVRKVLLVKRSNTIYRHSAPNSFDHAEQGTNCIVNEKELYIQTAQDETNPNWLFMGPYTPPLTL
jgi:hypothetical protein